MPQLLQRARPALKRIAGWTAPGVRLVLRTAPRRQRLLFWKFVGAPLSRGSWHYTARADAGFTLDASTVDVLGRYVYYFGVWEPNLTAWIQRQLHPGDTFVDVGANIGYYTLLASRIVGPAGRVVCIEASPRIVPQLMRNLALNAAANVRVVNVAVADREGVIDLYDGPAFNSGRTSVVQQEGLERRGTVPSQCLPEILTGDELSQARLFKVDVEGAEGLVVRGLRDALPLTRREAEFVIEISPRRLRKLGQSAQDIVGVFAAAGFNAYSIVHDYDPSYYIGRPAYVAPRRVVGEIVDEVDIIFSRRDEPSL